MPGNKGHINYALVERSTRLQKVVDLLKKSDHPLSGMEIQIQAWVVNASTCIVEINRNEGYRISEAHRWKGNALPWHDGNYRYFLIQAPGWEPRWIANKEGEILPYTEGHGARVRVQGSGVRSQDTTQNPVPSTLNPEPRTLNPEVRRCRLARCSEPISDSMPENTVFCCPEHKDEFWKLVRQAGFALFGVK